MTLVEQYDRAHRERVQRMWSAARPAVSVKPVEIAPDPRDVRISELEGEVAKLKAQIASRPKVFEPTATKRPTIAYIKTFIARTYGVSVRDIESVRRTSIVLIPRQVAMHLSRCLTLASYPIIGRQFGDRDHTTVISADKKITAKRLSDVEFDSKLAAFERELQGIPT